jgi:excisionase family DNA binding protein
VARPDARTELLTELLADGLDRVDAAARFLAMSRSTLYAMMASGALPFVKIGKSRRVPRRAVFELAVRGLVTAPSADCGALPGRGRGVCSGEVRRQNRSDGSANV